MRPPAFLTSRIIAAMRATLPSTRRSEETSLLMNAKPSRSRSRNSGVTRMPSWPQTTGSPAFTSRSLRQTGRPPETTMTASIRCFSTSIQRPPTRTWVRWLVVE